MPRHHNEEVPGDHNEDLLMRHRWDHMPPHARWLPEWAREKRCCRWAPAASPTASAPLCVCFICVRIHVCAGLLFTRTVYLVG
jgi:hypothetical protein